MWFGSITDFQGKYPYILKTNYIGMIDLPDAQKLDATALVNCTEFLIPSERDFNCVMRCPNLRVIKSSVGLTPIIPGYYSFTLNIGGGATGSPAIMRYTVLISQAEYHTWLATAYTTPGSSPSGSPRSKQTNDNTDTDPANAATKPSRARCVIS